MKGAIYDGRRMLYLDCSSGISGDMFVAALLDLGADREALSKALGSLDVGHFRHTVSSIELGGVSCCDFDVFAGDCNGSRTCCASHSGNGGGRTRRLEDILGIIDGADCTDGARTLAKRIFLILAEAESCAHGVSVEDAHFHEVGSIDSIVDIVAAAVLLDRLDVSGVVVTELVEGKGMVECEHGRLPVPVPAVSNIVQRFGLPLRMMDEEGEHVTPTGAAIIAAIRTDGELPERYRIIAAGAGAGKRYRDRPSVLKAFLISSAAPP